MENRKIILIVEDEKMIRDVLHLELVRQGFVVFEAIDGEEGLKISLKEHPDLVLLDLAMPKVEGMDMLRGLRNDEWGKSVPVIILTNLPSGDEERNRDITELEPTYYFVKTEKKMEEITDAIKDRLGLLR